MTMKPRTAAMFLAGALLLGAGAFTSASAGVPAAGIGGAAQSATAPAPLTRAHYTGYRHGHRYRRHYRRGYYVARRVCHRHRRVVRVWSRRYKRWVRRVVLCPRHCHMRRVYVR